MAKITTKYIVGVLIFVSTLIWCADGFCRDVALSVNIFQNLTGDARNDWIGVGLVDNIILNLRNVRGLQVVELAQLNRLMDVIKLSFSGLTDEATTIKTGKLLGVKYLVMGSFQIEGAELVVNYRMVEVETGKIIFSDMTKGKLSGVIEIEEKVGKRIMNNLKIRMLGLNIDPDAYKKPASETLHENYVKGITCSLKSDSDEGLQCYQDVLKEDPGNGDAYLGEGEIYLKDKNIVPALVRLNKALSIYKETNDNFFISRAYYFIAEAYYSQGDNSRAEGYYKDAVKASVENDFNIPLIYLRFSEIAAKKGQLKKAVKYAEEAVKDNEKLGNKFVQVNLLINLAARYRENNLLAKAKETFQEALELSRETGYPQLYELYKMDIELREKK